MLLAEIKEGALWRSISVIEVLARPRSVIRCAHCHQRLVAHGSFQPSATPHFVHYRMKLMGWTPPDGIDVPEWRC